jgi:hypothetical protein
MIENLAIKNFRNNTKMALLKNNYLNVEHFMNNLKNEKINYYEHTIFS